MRLAGFVFIASSFWLSSFSFAQHANGLVASFTFNDGNANDQVGGPAAKTVGIVYADDRFGNSRSACFLNGTTESYLNLGTGSNLKPAEGTISLWVKMTRQVTTGQGAWSNPIILTKHCPGDDYYEVYYIGYDLSNRKAGACTSTSSTSSAVVVADEPFTQDEWHHLVITYSDTALCFYVDGNLEGTAKKNFRSTFLAGDSVVVGTTANKKNVRSFAGYVDDISIYNKVLSADAISELYEEGDPNRYRDLVIIILASVSGLALIIFLIVRKFRKVLEKEKEKNRIQRQVFEMETRVIKAQMNPHFIFNSMNSIQQFILVNDNENANTYLVKFAKLLRKILESSTDENISLENEVDILSKYIEIESLRFERAFSYEIIVDEKLSAQNIRMPHMLIQPFVENAIWHGLLMKANSKNLKIAFEYVNPESLCCTIDDNGAGRNAEKVAGTLSKQKSLGIHFTSQRLELMRREWGGEYGVEIIDKVGEQGTSAGTRVVIRIPILKN